MTSNWEIHDDVLLFCIWDTRRCHGMRCSTSYRSWWAPAPLPHSRCAPSQGMQRLWCCRCEWSLDRVDNGCAVMCVGKVRESSAEVGRGRGCDSGKGLWEALGKTQQAQEGSRKRACVWIWSNGLMNKRRRNRKVDKMELHGPMRSRTMRNDIVL